MRQPFSLILTHSASFYVHAHDEDLYNFYISSWVIFKQVHSSEVRDNPLL